MARIATRAFRSCSHGTTPKALGRAQPWTARRMIPRRAGRDDLTRRSLTHLGRRSQSPLPPSGPPRVTFRVERARSLTLDTAARSKGQAVAALKGELTGKGVGANPVRVRGAMLWTHFGVSGPAVLDVSRHWHRSRLEGRQVAVFANFLPGDDFASAERKLLDLAGLRPTAQLHNALSSLLPARVAGALLAELGLDGSLPMAHLPREQRRKLVHALTAWPLPVTGGRGYGFAEVTAGGVPLSEIDPATMASRKCPGLYLVGEILDVDGRIGGFNFQWAWSSGFVAAVGLAAALTRDPSPPDPSLRSG